jgi:hypothetical protein
MPSRCGLENLWITMGWMHRRTNLWQRRATADQGMGNMIIF